MRCALLVVLTALLAVLFAACDSGPTNPPPPTPTPTVDIEADNSDGPVSVAHNQDFVLSWTTTNDPTACTASGDWGGGRDVLGGSETRTKPGPASYIFTLTCRNAGGSDSDSVTVDVAGPPPPDRWIRFTWPPEGWLYYAWRPQPLEWESKGFGSVVRLFVKCEDEEETWTTLNIGFYNYAPPGNWQNQAECYCYVTDPAYPKDTADGINGARSNRFETKSN